MCRTRALSRSATRMGTRKSARVRPRSAAVRAVEPGDRDRHLDSGAEGHDLGATDGAESSIGTHSYWTARTMDSRLAMRAG